MSGWDDEDFTPPPVKGASAAKKVVADSWEDEDTPTTNIQIKGQWDDEDAEPVPVPKPVVEPKKPAPAKAKKVASNKGATTAFVSTGDPLADKLREQRLVEASDYQNVEGILTRRLVMDMFGISDKKSERSEKGDEEGAEGDLLNQKPRTELDYEQFATQIAKRLSTHETSFHYPFFVKTLSKQLCASFTKAEDIKEIITVLNVLVNEKIKVKADKPKPKAKKAAGPTMGKKVYKDAFDDFDSKGKYDDDDDDFM